VVGLGTFAGTAVAFAFQRFTGALLEATGGSYAPIFAVLGLAYVVALALLHLLAPRLEPVA
jgi:ACS family hexuronate transporter-like MFS transporter